MADYDVIVIGAGLGGLSAGAILAHQGQKVLVLEQSDSTGGCCSTFEKDGYQFDIGASIVEAISTMQKAFKKLDTTLENEVELLPCDPIYSCIFRDKTKISYYLSLDKTAEEIGKISPKDKDNFYRFAEQFSRFINEGGEDFFTTPVNDFDEFFGLIKKRPIISEFVPFFLATYQDVIKYYFKDEKIRQSMAYQSFYASHPPDLCAGIFAMLPYLEHLGVFYPKGGMIQIPKALQRCGEKDGMEVKFNQRVIKVLIDGNKRASGVILEDGSIISSKVVISNVNAKTLYLDLVGEQHIPWLARMGINSYEYSLTAPMVYLGLDYEPPLDAHHTIIPLPIDDMNHAYWNTYRKGRIPQEQFGLICWPTATDPSLAPKDHHILNLILMGPYDLTSSDWETEKPRFIEQSIELLKKLAIPDLDKHVTVADMSTPLDYENRLLLPKGAIYGLQEDLTAQAIFRPASKSKCINGLYLTGASTHPGGGVPTTIGSGMIAAEQIQKYEF